jgi:hypothetical protein
MIKEAIKDTLKQFPTEWKFYKVIICAILWAAWFCAFVCWCIFNAALVAHICMLGGWYVVAGIGIFIVAFTLDFFLGMVTSNIFDKMQKEF